MTKDKRERKKLYWECECRGHREPISINDCICSPDNPKDLASCQRIEEMNKPTKKDWEEITKKKWYENLVALARVMRSGDEYTEIIFEPKELGFFIHQTINKEVKEAFWEGFEQATKARIAFEKTLKELEEK